MFPPLSFLLMLLRCLLSNCYLVDIQHVADGFAKGGLLRCERPSFVLQNMAFCTLKGGLLHSGCYSAAVLAVFVSAS